jgi:hypothetical protein
VRAVGDEGAGTGLRFDEPGCLQLAIDLADRHRRDADGFGKLAHRRQALARGQLAAGDPVFDEAAQLHAERHG